MKGWEAGGKRKVILNTHGTCFLCLEETETTTPESNCRESGLRDVCLRNVCRYLKLNQPEIILNAIGEENQGDDIIITNPREVSNCDLFVLLCPECASLTQQFSTLIRQLEMIQILMGHHLESFHKILTVSYLNEDNEEYAGSSKQTGKWKTLHEKLIAAGSDRISAVEARLVQNLRNKTVEKCSAKVTQFQMTCVPKVLLERCDTAVNTNSVKIRKINKGHPSFDQYQQEAMPRVNSQSKMVGAVEREPNDGNEDIHLQLNSAVNEYFKQVNPPGRFTCSMCEKSIKYDRKEHHLIFHHPEKFFLNCQHPHVTEVNFKELCTSILTLETKVCSEGQENSTLSHSVQCVHCDHNSSSGINLRHHLALHHYYILQEKIMNAQKECFPCLTGHNITRKIKRKFMAVWKCNTDEKGHGCGRTFSMKGNLQRHQNENCPVRKRQTAWKCQDDIKSRGCERTFSSQLKLRYHKNEACPFRKLRTVMKSISDGQGKGCGRDFATKNIISPPKSTACSKRKKGVWKCYSDISDHSCGKIFTSLKGLQLHKREYCTNKRLFKEDKGQFKRMKLFKSPTHRGPN